MSTPLPSVSVGTLDGVSSTNPAWFESIVEMSPEAIFVIQDGVHAFANPAGLTLLGARSLEEIRSRPAIEFLVEEQRDLGIARVAVTLDGERTDFLRERVVRLDGNFRETEACTTPVVFKGRPATLVLTRDITEQAKSEAARRRAEGRFIAALESAPTGIGLLDADGCVVLANDVLSTLRRPSLGVGERLRDALVDEDRALLDGLITEATGAVDGSSSTVDIRFAGVPDRTFEASTRLIGADDAARFVMHVHDVTEQREQSALLTRLARTDDLTGLPSRKALTRELVASLKPRGASMAVAFCDVDNFKTINDSLGHQVGDQLLVAVGDRLRQAVRGRDFLARFGGDEFVILLRDTTDEDSVRAAVERISFMLTEPFELNGRGVHVSASIGVAFARHGDDPSTVLGDADAAMYDAKANGRARYELSRSEHRTRAETRLEIDRSLRIALEHEELEPHFQPVVEVATGRIVAVEALVRWNRAGEMVPPGTFIPIAEANGMIGPVDRYMIERSVRQLRKWMDDGVVDGTFRMSANIAPRELTDDSLVESLRIVLSRYELNHHQLMLEVTERRAINTTGIASAITTLGHLGVDLAVDDFGVGHSSLARLSEIPFEVLKLDQAFIAGAVEDERKARLLDGVVRLGESLGHTVLAEGVETEQQLQLLVDSGVELAQGYHLARPADAATITELLCRNRERFAH
ncbi:MAG: putative bifunctional diguanylate cyclase/phosphodiesterase [Ilumatobacter sp.]